MTLETLLTQLKLQAVIEDAVKQKTGSKLHQLQKPLIVATILIFRYASECR